MLFRRFCLAVATMVVLNCSGNGDPSPVSNRLPPEDHTVSQGGRLHAPGLDNPQENCASCNGQDLQGGSNQEPSCFQCHGDVWSR